MLRKTEKTLPGATPSSAPASMVTNWPAPAIAGVVLHVDDVARRSCRWRWRSTRRGARRTTIGTLTFSKGFR